MSLSLYPHGDDRLSKDYAYFMQQDRLEIFESQDVEKGRFDVIFELEGKQLHAHQFILTSVSETMDAWLTDRWTKKDEVIKIESYSYDNFYQFLCFLYSGECEITDENVREMVDLAEFYGVQLLKEYCDKFLSNTEKSNVRDIEEMYEFAEKYSLFGFIDAIKNCVIDNAAIFIKSLFFMRFKKPFVQFISFLIDGKYREEFFETVYKWAEGYVVKEKTVDDDNFNLQEAIKNELNTIFPDIKFYKMSFLFLMNFVVEKGFILSSDDLFNFFDKFKLNVSYLEEYAFERVYQLAEKQALKKQLASSDGDNFNVAESIKDDLAQVIPCVKFYQIDKKKLIDIYVAKGCFSEAEVIQFLSTRVEIKNGDKLFTGVFIDEHGIRYAFEKLHKKCQNTRPNTINKLRFFNVKLPIPKASSTVKKMKGCEWYLCLEGDGILTFKHYTRLERSDYLLAEMKTSDDYEFRPNTGAILTFSDNNNN